MNPRDEFACMSNEANLTGACAGPGNAGNPLVDAGEERFTLTGATKVMPRVNGKRPAVSTLWRWCRKGLRGRYLDYVRVGRVSALARRWISSASGRPLSSIFSAWVLLLTVGR